MKKCSRFDGCSAPLCPEDGQSLSRGIWYPKEEICNLKAYQNLPFILNQKKIQRTKGIRGYFTFRMLNRKLEVTRYTQGLNPDKPRDPQERAWLNSCLGVEVTQDLKEAEIKKVAF